MNGWHAVVFGVVEGLTEFLPVSSTGHLILTARLLGLPQTEFLKSFEIAIQLGAMLAVVVVYGKSLLGQPEVTKRVLTALAPTLAIGFLLYEIVKGYLFSDHSIILASLVLGGIALILFDRWHREGPCAVSKMEDIPYPQAFLIGFVQALAVVPGVSRAGATIVGGLALGLSRKTVVEFSFLLAVPTILAATVLDVTKNGSSFAQADWSLLLLGSSVSFVVALVSIRFFLHYIQRSGFLVFGVYRILLAAAFWIFVK